MVLSGKKAVFLGDSITEGFSVDAPEKVYHQVLKKLVGLREAVSYGIGGTRIARQKLPSSDPKCDQDFNLRVGAMDADADIVFVFGGTNDYGHGDAPLGAMGDRTVWTFYGALTCLFDALICKYGKEKIIVLLPMHRTNDTGRYGDGSKKNAGHILADYVKAIREVAGRFDLKIIDLFSEAGLDPNDKEVGAKYFADGLHPNNAGHSKLAEVIADALTNFSD